MPQNRILRECTRSFSREGREFTASYFLGEESDAEGKRCFIRAALRETNEEGTDIVTSTAVDLLYLRTDIGKRIFEVIAGAEDPVFPVHVPDIVRDQISATALIEVKP